MSRVCFIMSVYKNDNLQDFQVALESLYTQSIKGIDIYIQEDGEVEINIHNFLLKELESNRISYLGLRNVNKGIAYSRKELVKLILSKEYQYIALMDADDISMPQRIENQLKFMEHNKEIDVCGTFIKEFGDNIDYSKVVTYPLTHIEMFDFFKKRVPLANVTSMFRRSFFQKAGLYEVNGHLNNEDTLMWMKGFMSGCQFANIDYVGVKVRVSKDFFGRRGGWEKTVSDFKNRMTVNKTLNFGPLSYFYALAVAFLNIMPSTLKKYAYKHLRQ